MHLPILKKENRYRRSIVAFGGINLTEHFSEGELREGVGISHKKFPFITQRNKLVKEFECNSPTSAIFGENECVATNDALYYNKNKVGNSIQLASKLADTVCFSGNGTIYHITKSAEEIYDVKCRGKCREGQQ